MSDQFKVKHKREKLEWPYGLIVLALLVAIMHLAGWVAFVTIHNSH